MEPTMQETPQEYTDRILSYQQGQKPLSIIAATPKKLERLLKGKTRLALSRRPAPDKWSIAEILAHLADAELVFSWRIRLMLSVSGSLIQAFEQDDWARIFEYPKHDPRLSLEILKSLREGNVQLLRLVPRGMWDNFGMHEERGKETITRLLEMTAGHDVNHLRQVEAMFTKPKGGKRK
jgi:hypothetical protein